MNLLEQLTETSYLLDYRFIIRQYTSGMARYIGRDTWEWQRASRLSGGTTLQIFESPRPHPLGFLWTFHYINTVD